MESSKTDVLIIGAGPVGLFAVFELGLFDMKCRLIDILDRPGGQCAELYPEKPIYDIPAWPSISAQGLVDKLMEQIAPFKPEFSFNRMVSGLEKLEDGTFRVTTDENEVIEAKVVVIAAGGGSFQPKRPPIPGIEAYEGTSVFYSVRRMEEFRDHDLVIVGGGDSALDWTLEFAGKARSVTLVHRRPEFRAAPASVAKMHDLVSSGSMRYVEAIAQSLIVEGGEFKGVRVKKGDGALEDLHADRALVFFGLHPKLGPIAEWGLGLDKRAILVDTEKFQTSVPGIYAVGDINTYPGKKKLILSGFHEAALAAFAVAAHLNPAKKIPLQYTTTSPIMQKRLGVAGEQ